MDTPYTVKDNIDRISVLPNEVLCHILSFLQTKEVAGTSILSTKWKNLLPLIPNLQLKLVDTELLHPHPPSIIHLISFKNFVHNLLNFTLLDTPSIQSLTLICHKIDNGQLIANWINAALRLNIKMMHIRVPKLQKQKFFLDSLYGSNLVSLTLVICFSNDVTEFRFSLPKLKKLCLHYMGLSPVNALLASCPVLNILMLINCHCFQPGERLRIHSPSLMYLKVVNSLLWVKCVVELHAPQLLHMCHCGYVLIHNTRGGNDLWIVCVDRENSATRVSYYYDKQAPELMKQVCSGAEKVWMSEKFISKIYREPHYRPMFQKVTSFTIMNMNAHGWEMLPYLFDSAPNLKSLYLKDDFDKARLESFKASRMESMSFCLLPYTNNVSHLLIERKKKNEFISCCLKRKR